MMAIYGTCSSPLLPLSLHVAKQRWKEAAEMLGRIRKLVALNLTLGC